jgi:acetyl esterase/lipase
MADGSPQHHLDARSAATPLPPALLVYGERDENIPEEITERFVAAYRSAAGRLDVARYAGMPHGFINGSSATAEAAADALDRITTFIKKYGVGGEI